MDASGSDQPHLPHKRKKTRSNDGGNDMFLGLSSSRIRHTVRRIPILPRFSD